MAHRDENVTNDSGDGLYQKQSFEKKATSWLKSMITVGSVLVAICAWLFSLSNAVSLVNARVDVALNGLLKVEGACVKLQEAIDQLKAKSSKDELQDAGLKSVADNIGILTKLIEQEHRERIAFEAEQTKINIRRDVTLERMGTTLEKVANSLEIHVKNENGNGDKKP